MLAHTAAAQGTVAVDNILGHSREIDYRSILAATFTHPEISSVGLSEVDARNSPPRRASILVRCAATGQFQGTG